MNEYEMQSYWNVIKPISEQIIEVREELSSGYIERLILIKDAKD